MSSPWEKMQRGKKRGTSLSPGYSHMKGEGRLEREGVSKENEGVWWREASEREAKGSVNGHEGSALSVLLIGPGRPVLGISQYIVQHQGTGDLEK